MRCLPSRLRRPLFLLLPVLAAGVLFSACQDRGAAPSGPEGEASAARGGAAAPAAEADIDRLINQLFPAGPERAEANRAFSRVKAAKAEGDLESARDRMLALVDLVLEAARAGELVDPRGPTSAAEGAAELIRLLFDFVGLEAPPITADVVAGDGGADVVDEDGGTVVAGDGGGAVEVPAGAFDGPVLITLERLEDPATRGEGPLPTDEDQFPPFYEIEASEQPSSPVAVGTCVPTSGSLAPTASEAARLAITKTVTGDPSSATRLEATDAGFLSCDGGEAAVAGLASGFSTAGATAMSFEQAASGTQFSCGLLSDGSAWCWGDNTWGQLGNGTATSTTAPDTVEASVDFVQISAGSRHACGITAGGDAWCWGNNEYGQLGDGTTTDRSTPVQVSSTANFEEIDAGFEYTCARDASGILHCWGQNDNHQLGVTSSATCTGRFDTDPCELTPVTLGSRGPYSQADVGLWVSCAVAGNGDGECWGTEILGALGNGPFEADDSPVFADVAAPQAVSGGLTFDELEAGAVYGCGLTTGGQAWCWGPNYSGKLGNGTDEGVLEVVFPDGSKDTVANDLEPQGQPVQVAGGHTFTQITAHDGNNAGGHTCAIDGAGSAWCWGANLDGELGATASETCELSGNTFPCSTTPVQVSGGLTWTDIDINAGLGAEGAHSCGVAGGDVYCWGFNGLGQLGDGTTTSRSTPTQIAAPGTGSASPSVGVSASTATSGGSDATLVPMSEEVEEALEEIGG